MNIEKARQIVLEYESLSSDSAIRPMIKGAYDEAKQYVSAHESAQALAGSILPKYVVSIEGYDEGYSAQIFSKVREVFGDVKHSRKWVFVPGELPALEVRAVSCEVQIESVFQGEMLYPSVRQMNLPVLAISIMAEKPFEVDEDEYSDIMKAFIRYNDNGDMLIEDYYVRLAEYRDLINAEYARIEKIVEAKNQVRPSIRKRR